jgi:hypothetical protein
MLSKYVAIIIAFIIIGTTASAAVPNTLSWQGTIKDSNGDNLDGNFNFTFSIYDVSTGGTALWSETHSSVPVSDGLVSVILGKITPINLLFGGQYYLGISINAGAELPRIEMSSSAYAFRAKSAEIASDVETGTIEGGLGAGHIVPNTIKGTDLGAQQIDTRELKDNSVTSSKIGIGEVSGNKGTAGPHIEVSSIGYVDLADDAVRSDIIMDGEVKADDIGNFEVSGSEGTAGPHIEPFSIGNDDLADDAVTSEIIKDGEVKADDIGTLEIQDYHIDFGVVVRDLNSLTDFVEIVGGNCIDVSTDIDNNLIWIDYICDDVVYIPFVGENNIDGDGIRLDGEDGITIRVGGEIVVQFDKEGHSYHKREEIYEYGIFVGDTASKKYGVEIFPQGITVADSTGYVSGTFTENGLETTGEIRIVDGNYDTKVVINDSSAFFSGKIVLLDNNLEPIFYADSSGSYHYVKEHFYEGIEVADRNTDKTSNITPGLASFYDGLIGFYIGLGDGLLSAIDEDEEETVDIKKDGTFSITPPVGSFEFVYDTQTEETKLDITETNVVIQQSLDIPWGDDGHRFVSSVNGFGVFDDQGAFVPNWASDPNLNPFGGGGGGGDCCLEDGEPFVWKNADGNDVFEINGDDGLLINGAVTIENGEPFVWQNSSSQDRFIIGNNEISTKLPVFMEGSQLNMTSSTGGLPFISMNNSNIFSNTPSGNQFTLGTSGLTLKNLPITINNASNVQRGKLNSNGSFEFGTSSSNNIMYQPSGENAGLTLNGSQVNANGGLNVPLSNGNTLEITPDDGIRIMDGFNYVAHMNPSGSTYFTGTSTFAGPVYIEEISSFCDLILTGGNNCDVIINNNVDATGSEITADAFNESSDERLKENIIPVTNALDLLKGINGYYYNLIEDEDKTRQIGFIAQQIQTALPEVVKKRKDGLLSVSYGHVTSLLVESVKSLLDYVEKQQIRIDKQESRIKNLESEIASMKQNLAEVEQLKSQMSEMQNIIKTMNKMMKETEFLESKLIMDKE